MKRWAMLAVVPLLALSLGHAPDSWRPFQDRRVVSMSGRKYVVVRKTSFENALKSSFGVDFEICERRAGAAAMQPAIKAAWYGKKDVDISRDPEDRLIASGHISQVPMEVRVLDDLGGFVLFEQHGGLGLEKAVIYVNDAGEVVMSKTVSEIFGETLKGAWSSVSSLHWYRGFWLAEERASVVVLSNGDQLREISLVDGKVTTPELASWLDAFHLGVDAGRELAIELGSRMDLEDLNVAYPHALRLVEDESQSIAIRIRAAVLLIRAGSTKDFTDLFLGAAKIENEKELRRYAIANLPLVMDEAAIPFLREFFMDGNSWEARVTCAAAFVELGDVAVPVLCEMILEQGRSSGYRGGVAGVLKEIGSSEALPALEEVFSRADEVSREYQWLWSAIQACKR